MTGSLEVRVRSTAASRKKYPEKARARNAVQYAVRNGVLIRPERCSKCLKACRPEASHDDYKKPLDVEWLCRSCHVKKDRYARESLLSASPVVPKCPLCGRYMKGAEDPRGGYYNTCTNGDHDVDYE